MKIAITGAQSYTGRYVTQLLLNKGAEIVNLTNHARDWNIKSNGIKDHPLRFERKHLVDSLRGCESLVQTYWVRFDNTLGLSREQVTENSKMLIDCAKEAGVKKIVYTSHTQTSLNSPFDYIR
jgi:nucleoside-diphosphate-sugar epimerase